MRVRLRHHLCDAIRGAIARVLGRVVPDAHAAGSERPWSARRNARCPRPLPPDVGPLAPPLSAHRLPRRIRRRPSQVAMPADDAVPVGMAFKTGGAFPTGNPCRVAPSVESALCQVLDDEHVGFIGLLPAAGQATQVVRPRSVPSRLSVWLASVSPSASSWAWAAVGSVAASSTSSTTS